MDWILSKRELQYSCGFQANCHVTGSKSEAIQQKIRFRIDSNFSLILSKHAKKKYF